MADADQTKLSDCAAALQAAAHAAGYAVGINTAFGIVADAHKDARYSEEVKRALFDVSQLIWAKIAAQPGFAESKR